MNHGQALGTVECDWYYGGDCNCNRHRKERLMIDLDLTDDELRAEWLRARKLEALCAKHGEADPRSDHGAMARACEAEAKERGIGL